MLANICRNTTDTDEVGDQNAVTTSKNASYGLMSYETQHECHGHEYELVASKNSQPACSTTTLPSQQQTNPQFIPTAEIEIHD